MKNLLTTVLLSTFLFVNFQLSAQELPKLTKLVNDYTGTLSNAEQNALTRKLIAYNDSTSSQVAILIVNDYQGYEAMDYTIRVAENSGIGQSDKDNGILITVAMAERKMAIATGYGMEDRITDAATSTIREEYMKPAFRAGDYYKGLDDATTIIFDLAAGKYTADKIASKSNGKGIGLGAFLILFFVIITIISRINRVRKHHMGGGSMDLLTILMLMNSGSRHRGSWNDFNSGGGGFGGGGGGFGGFGGGSFGGGGSSGSW